jgi:hypothetical protein
MVTEIGKTIVPAAAVIAFLGLIACTGPSDAQTIINENGAWQIAAPADADTAHDKFSMSTLALDQSGGKFSLSCRKDASVYYFWIEGARPSVPGLEEEARFSIRVTNQDAVWFQTAWRGGGIEVREGVHQTAFSIVMSLLTEPSAANVEFTVRGDQWPFSLAGFLEARADLRQHCGHDFASERMLTPSDVRLSSRGPRRSARQTASPAPAVGSGCRRA